MTTINLIPTDNYAIVLQHNINSDHVITNIYIQFFLLPLLQLIPFELSGASETIIAVAGPSVELNDIECNPAGLTPPSLSKRPEAVLRIVPRKVLFVLADIPPKSANPYITVHAFGVTVVTSAE